MRGQIAFQSGAQSLVRRCNLFFQVVELLVLVDLPAVRRVRFRAGPGCYETIPAERLAVRRSRIGIDARPGRACYFAEAAARPMMSATASGWAMNTAWLAATVRTVAPMRSAMNP